MDVHVLYLTWFQQGVSHILDSCFFLICAMQGIFKFLLYKYYPKFVKAYKVNLVDWI